MKKNLLTCLVWCSIGFLIGAFLSDVLYRQHFRTFTGYKTGKTVQVDPKSISSIVPIIGDEQFSDRTRITLKDGDGIILVDGIIEN
jgi:multidrug resistance efflux pump